MKPRAASASTAIASCRRRPTNDRVSFVLTEQLQVKKLAFLDILKEDAERQAENADDLFAANFTLMSGELAQLLAHLVEALGGEGE